MMREVGFAKVSKTILVTWWGDKGRTALHSFDYFPKDFLLIIDESHVTVLR